MSYLLTIFTLQGGEGVYCGVTFSFSYPWPGWGVGAGKLRGMDSHFLGEGSREGFLSEVSWAARAGATCQNWVQCWLGKETQWARVRLLADTRQQV